MIIEMNWLNDASSRTAYGYEQKTSSCKNWCLTQHFAIDSACAFKTLCQNICRKEQVRKKRKTYDQDLQWNHYRRKNMEKKYIPPKSVLSGYRRKSVEDCKPLKPHNSLRTPYQFEPHADSKSLPSIEISNWSDCQGCDHLGWACIIRINQNIHVWGIES